jgi:Ca2+-binding EF-hand superfamily protein
MMNILITNTYDDELMLRDNEETIAKAFEILDKEKKGYLETDNLVRLLKTYGEPMDDDEIREFLHAAEDPTVHQIRYEEYAHVLSSE